MIQLFLFFIAEGPHSNIHLCSIGYNILPYTFKQHLFCLSLDYVTTCGGITEIKQYYFML